MRPGLRPRRVRKKFVPRHLRSPEHGGPSRPSRNTGPWRFPRTRLPRWFIRATNPLLANSLGRVRPLLPPRHQSASAAATPKPTTPLPASVPIPGSGPVATRSRRDAWQWLGKNYGVLILNFGSICTMTAFTRDDILQLRILSATGSISSAVYFFTRAGPLQVLPMAWSSVFASLNAYMISKILLERKGRVIMTTEDQDVYEEHFLPHGVTPRQFERLVAKARREELAPGDVLFRRGDPVRHVRLIVHGKTTATGVLSRKVTAASSSPGQRHSLAGGDSGAWIGEIHFLEWLGRKVNTNKVAQKKGDGGKVDPTPGAKANGKDDRDQPLRSANFSYSANEPTSLLIWSFDDLAEIVGSSTDMRSALTRAMTAAIVGKVVNLTVDHKAAKDSGAAWLGWLGAWAGKGTAPATSTVVKIEDLKNQKEGDLDVQINKEVQKKEEELKRVLAAEAAMTKGAILI
mmetsp:Transcript_12599/g.25201  ORF Transcript_12599/g.25201 Transcript_12599/m.25201 type:complete len:460 (+) Transcript_12599:119-1498(+)